MKTRFQVRVVSTLAVLMVAGLADGQQLQKTAAPIDVAVKPTTVALNTPVQISGTAAVDGKHLQVKVTVTPPAGKSGPTLLAATADPKGNYNATFSGTNAAGNYQVRVVAPDGKGVATAQFTVVEASSGVNANLDQAVTAAKDVLSATEEAEGTAERLISSQPKSPAQEEALARLNQLKSRLKEAPQQISQIKPGWLKVQDALNKHPQALPAFQPLLTDLDQWRTQAKNESDRIRHELQKSMTKGMDCDRIDAAVQVLNWVSYGLDFTDELPVKVRTVVEDKALPDRIMSLLPVKDRNENVKFLFAEALKAEDAAIRGPAAWFGAAVGLAVDTVAFVKQRDFSRFCEKFQGPISATLHSDFYENGRHYWSYDEELSGQLVLRYAKASSAGQAIHFSGEYEGYATRFTLWDDFIALYPKMASDVLYHSDRPPLAHKDSALENWAGRIPNTLFNGPTSFSIPVEGDFIKDKITPNLGNAEHDIDVKGKVVYIFLAPGVFIPDTVVAEAPYQTAYWIISRSIGMKPEFTVTVDQKNRVSVIQRDFSRDADAPNGSYRLKFKASVKACNPECP
ncbi:MAG TPA: hypothetical protein VFI72_10610 [Candidatus Angelobacter sp.]|nr:hypothetical protein [Candidatus Angelobacter sp.]